MSSVTIHREEYVYLAGLTENSALIAWGAFFFKVKGALDGGEWELIRDKDLQKYKEHSADLDRVNLIGSSSKPYAQFAGEQPPVEVRFIKKESGDVVTQFYGRTNHVELQNLEPDTVYSYTVKVNGKEWGGGPLRDWDPRAGGMALSNGSYRNEFRTLPRRTTSVPKLTFAAIGDFGRGVRTGSHDELCQSEVAKALEKAVDDHNVRLILSTGDNIYNTSQQGSGDEDSDWFFTYFQPYRYIINRVPVFTCIGNHDEGETFGESSDDRIQMYDNMYVGYLFLKSAAGEAQHQPGLFYRFRCGSDVEFICLDTSKRKWLGAKRYFRHPDHKAFLDRVFPEGASQLPRWRIPFFHHPPYSAGPVHFNDDDVIEDLVPMFKRAGVRAAFSGHEHNFQYSVDEGVSFFVTGGAGKFRSAALTKFDKAKTKAWGGNDEGHFVLVTIEGDTMTVFPFGRLKEGNLRPITTRNPAGDQVAPPFEVTA